MKNDSSLASYTNENQFKMSTDCSIFLKTGKNIMSAPQDASKTLSRRFQDASNRFQDISKPQENRQDGLRSLNDMGKQVHNASQTPQQASKWHPRRL